MINVYQNSEEFLDKHKNFLSTDEVKNNLIIGISSRTDIPNMYFLASIQKDNILIGVLAGKNLILAANTLEEDVYIDLVKYMENISYPGIIGEKQVCQVYQTIFENLTNKKMIVGMDQRIYYCDVVQSNYQSDAIVRLARESDFEILRIWYNAFHTMVEGPIDFEESDASLHKTLLQNRLFVLEKDGEIVSMAGRSRPLLNSETIALVYTPDVHRRNGYASLLVEKITRLILKDKKMATLYTDLSNPISNSIYMKIGFKPYCDSLILNIVGEQEKNNV